MILSKKFKANYVEKRLGNRTVGEKIVRDFQWKYTLFLLASILGSVSLYLAVTLWHQFDNYEIFRRLAFDSQPDLIKHLERELTWLTIFMVATFVTIGIFVFTIGMKLTANMIKPISQMELHMKKVIRGDWSSPEFQYNQNEDLSDILSTYSYLYRTLRSINEADISKLEKIVIDPHDRESLLIWNQILNAKCLQLKIDRNLVPRRAPQTKEALVEAPKKATEIRRAS